VETLLVSVPRPRWDPPESADVLNGGPSQSADGREVNDMPGDGHDQRPRGGRLDGGRTEFGSRGHLVPERSLESARISTNGNLASIMFPACEQAAEPVGIPG
jgi:hypothetical protein